MTLPELNKILSEKLSNKMTLQNQLLEVVKEIDNINNQIRQKKVDYFFEYLKPGYSHEIKSYFNGRLTPQKDSESIYLQIGDKFELVKRNKKSFVIKVVEYKQRKYDTETKRRIETIIYPNWLYRISVDDLYYNLLKDPQFNKSFDTWMSREDVINSLLTF
jgi:hypothetical protein